MRSMLPGRISRKDESGFTMLEILASVAILSIAVIPMLSLLTSAPVLHAEREQQTRAAFLAQLKLEAVKQKVLYDDDFAIDYDEAATAFSAPDSEFKYTVTDTDDPGGDDMKDLTVHVWYDENDSDSQDAGEQTVTLKTKVAKR